MRHLPDCFLILGICALIGMCSYYRHAEDMAKIQHDT